MGCKNFSTMGWRLLGEMVANGLQVQRLQVSVRVLHHKLVQLLHGMMGGYGHVAVVTAVESSTRIQVSECNYDGSGTQPIGNYRGWFNPTASRGTVRYIYPN